jgi:hypothetical protein
MILVFDRRLEQLTDWSSLGELLCIDALHRGERDQLMSSIQKEADVVQRHLTYKVARQGDLH